MVDSVDSLIVIVCGDACSMSRVTPFLSCTGVKDCGSVAKLDGCTCNQWLPKGCQLASLGIVTPGQLDRYVATRKPLNSG